MSYGAGLYGSTLYGAAPGSAGPEVYAPSVSLRVIVCAGQVVTPVVHLRVTVSETYTPTLPLEITVRRPRFAPVVPLSISVFETYTPVLVITSYSIHYTKLYDKLSARILADATKAADPTLRNNFV